MSYRPALASRGAALCLAALCLVGCRKSELVADMDYDDPKKALAAMDDAKRDTWLMPERVVRSLGIENKGGVIADIGAGSGYFSRRLAGEVPGGTVYAVDVDDEFRGYIEHNRESWGTPNIEPHLAFYDDPALPEHGIDLVFVSNTYPYLRSRVSYFKKVRSALKPGGRLAVINFKPDADVPGRGECLERSGHEGCDQRASIGAGPVLLVGPHQHGVDDHVDGGRHHCRPFVQTHCRRRSALNPAGR